MADKKTVIVMPHNHFDPSWRRCFDRKAKLGDTQVASYAEIEKQIIDRWLAYDQPFTEGQAALLRKYVEKRPENKAALSAMAKARKLACPLTGETVQDTNLPAPEGLVRNFLCALPFYRELAGDDHDGYALTWAEDSFGNSPNYPQIVRGVGVDTLCKITYKMPAGRIWTGLDGSKVASLERFYREMGVGSFEKHAWCDKCRGEGCEACGGTGVRFVPPLGYDALCGALESAVAAEEPLVVVNIGGEENLPEETLRQAVEAVQAKHPQADIRLGTILDAYDCVRGAIESELAEDAGKPEDLNPVFQGCYSSRIAVKQRVRALTYRLCAAESALAARAYQTGEALRQPEDIGTAWQRIAFCQFHDVITGTLIDSAYAEAMDMLDEAEAILDRYLPRRQEKTGDPAPTPAGSEPYVLHWGAQTVTVDDTGILSVSTEGRELVRQRLYGRQGRPLRIGELVMEADAGDAWAMRIGPTFSPADNQTLIPLANYQKITELSDSKVVWSGVYGGTDYMVRSLNWTVTLTRGENDALLFHTAIDWDTASRCIKAVFPIAAMDTTALYEVPFGYTAREYDAAKVNYSDWSPNYMEYPAQNWVMKKVDGAAGVALFNRGIPGYRWIPGCFEMSLLRSPQFHFVGNEPRNYDFNDLDGLRDSGPHSFDYALLPFADGMTPAKLAAAGLRFNQQDAFTLPFAVSAPAVVTAFKPAEDGDGQILRFYNPEGEAAEIGIDFGKSVCVQRCNLLEKNEGEAVQGEIFREKLRGFGIETLRIRPI